MALNGKCSAGTFAESSRRSAPDVAGFKGGRKVWYAGSITRSGANAEFHLVDERIVGKKPSKIGWADAAALPLTSLTAWEAFFVRLDVKKPVPGAAILIIGGAGGVGSPPPDRTSVHQPHRYCDGFAS